MSDKPKLKDIISPWLQRVSVESCWDVIDSQYWKSKLYHFTYKDQECVEFVKEKDWTASNLEKIGRNLVKQTNWSARELFMTLRIIITNQTATPPLFDTMKVLGKKKVIDRLQYAQKKL